MSSYPGSRTESTDKDGPVDGIPTSGFSALEQLYRSAPIGLALLDNNLRYVMINERLAAINGKPAEAHIGRTIREIIPEIASQVEAVCRRVIGSGRAELYDIDLMTGDVNRIGSFGGDYEVRGIEWVPPPCDPCDMNCDGRVDRFDVEPFLDDRRRHLSVHLRCLGPAGPSSSVPVKPPSVSLIFWWW